MPDHHPNPSGDNHLSAFSATRSPEPAESYADGVGGDVGRYVRENSFITWAGCLLHLTASRLRVFLPQSQGGFFPFKGFPVSSWGQKGIARGRGEGGDFIYTTKGRPFRVDALYIWALPK